MGKGKGKIRRLCFSLNFYSADKMFTLYLYQHLDCDVVCSNRLSLKLDFVSLQLGRTDISGSKAELTTELFSLLYL